MPTSLTQFASEIEAIQSEFVQPADIVLEAAPLMFRLLPHLPDILSDEHKRGCADHYARNLVYESETKSISLYSMVWGPGQWTPVHDHGAWGLVSIVSGALQERNYIRTDTQERPDSGVILRRAGVSILSGGSVTSFVPNPDHIHRTGVPRDWEPTITVHLYGRNMNRYNVYDMELGRRTSMDIADDNPSP